MSDMSADARNDISRQWIKANVLGGIAYNAAPAISDFIIRSAGIGARQVGSIELIVLGVVYLATYAVGLLWLGYLTGLVLRQKLPLFPLPAWLILFGLSGLCLALLMTSLWLMERAELDDLGFGDLVLLAVVGMLGTLLGAIAGALQAFVLRKTAKGLRTWIVFSAVSGLSLLVMEPVIVYGPRSGLAKDVVEAGAGLFATVVGALIMLPAVHQLRSR